MSDKSGWGVLLDGVYLSGGQGPQMYNCSTGVPGIRACTPIPGTEHVTGCLTAAPDGLGLPALRTSDQVMLGQDGISMGADFYENRVLTFSVTVAAGSCDSCTDARAKTLDIMRAFSRRRESTELVIFPSCSDLCDGKHLPNAYGFIGRPRSATLKQVGGRTSIAELVLRFDAEDHRAFMLDKLGTPGSGAKTFTIPASALTEPCTDYPKCFDFCFSEPAIDEDGIVDVFNPGSETALPTVRISGEGAGYLPQGFAIMNLDTRETLLAESGVAGASDFTYDPESFTATIDGAMVPSGLIQGSISLQPGSNRVKYVAVGYSTPPADMPAAELVFRPAHVAVV